MDVPSVGNVTSSALTLMAHRATRATRTNRIPKIRFFIILPPIGSLSIVFYHRKICLCFIKIKSNNSITSLFCQTKDKMSKENNSLFPLILKNFVEKEGIMSQDFLWVFLLSVLSSNNDTNLATNTNILLLLLLGLSNSNNFGNSCTSSCACRRCFGNNNFF